MSGKEGAGGTEDPKLDSQSNSASGANNDNPSGKGGEGTVSYETYQKTVNQEKNLRARLKEAEEKLGLFETKQREAEEAESLKKGEYEKVIAAKNDQIKALEAKTTEFEESRKDAKKMNALQKSFSAPLKNQEYWVHFDLDKVVIDPTTGEVDEASAVAEANRVKQTLPEIFSVKGSHQLPGDAAKQSKGTEVPYETWLKMSYRDKMKNMKNVKRE